MATIPGVYVNTSVRTGPPTVTAPAGAALFAVGEATHGPINEAKTVGSMAEFVAEYGNRYGDGYLYDTIQTFFEEGGQQAHILRVWKGSGGGTDVGTSELATSVTNTALHLDAKNVGAWGNSLTVLHNTVNRKITLSGTPDGIDEVFSYAAGGSDVANLRDIINHTVTGSKWVTARIALADSQSGTVDNTATLNAISAAQSFSDATAADTMDATTIADAWGVDVDDPSHGQYFTASLGSGMVASPGWGPTGTTFTDDGTTRSSVWVNMIKHCVANNRIACLTFGDDEMSVANTVTYRDAFVTGVAGVSGLPDDTYGLEYAAMYHPHVKIPNGSGSTRSIDPSGYVAAARARAHAAAGAWRAGAGAISAGRFVLEPTLTLTAAQLEDLAEAQINPIRSVAGSLRVYGARSASTDDVNWTFITFRDLLNYVSIEVENVIEPFVFSVIDSRGQIFAKIEGALVGMLEAVRQDGGLYERRAANGNLVDRGYTVVAGNSINTAATLNQGLIKAEVGVRVSPVGERVQISITKSALTSGL